MDPSRIAHLLAPFLNDAKLANTQLTTISTYIDLLLRWNTRINLTAVRDPEEIVTRHFGESLFAALHLFPPENSRPHPGAPGFASFAKPGIHGTADFSGLLDLGSGAGFPGIPIKLWAPHLHVTLIESNQKKAIFLREVCRAITLTDVNVIAARAEAYTGAAAGTVTMRAVLVGSLLRSAGWLSLSEPRKPVVLASCSPTSPGLTRSQFPSPVHESSS